MADWLTDKQEQKIRLVAWPSPQDYNEAIQNPSSCFQDRELIGLSPQMTALGLPKPATGNFATVYNLSGSGHEFAVRCFLHPLKDEQVRYAALSKCLQRNRLPNCVRFEFIETGIKVHDQWRPIVKMEWADGESIVEYVRKVRSQPDRLTKLAENFQQMVLQMSDCGIAHGDLQHGNVIVDGEQIKLVDYDAVFVPELEGLSSNELGHPNYQHPQRTAEFFNHKLDRFSAWVIYASLKILALDSSLWQVLSAGDECLLFRQADYQNPETSKTFFALETHPNPQIRLWSKHIRWLLSVPIDQLPNLDAIVVEPDNLPTVAAPSVSFDNWSQLWSLTHEKHVDDQSVSGSGPTSGAPSGTMVTQAGGATPGASIAQATGTMPGPPPYRRAVAISPLVVTVMLTVLLAVVFYYAQLLGGQKPQSTTRSVAAQDAAPADGSDQVMDKVDSSTLRPSQLAYRHGIDAQRNNLRQLESDYFRAALAADKSDHSLNPLQVGMCWHQIGHWQQDKDEGDHGVSAFQHAYDAYALSGSKYTNILGDLAHSCAANSNYLAATKASFEALRVGLFGGGTDQDIGFFTGATELNMIRSWMPKLFKQDPKSALELYQEMCNYLAGSPKDSYSVRAKEMAPREEFLWMLIGQADTQLADGDIDTAQKLADLIGKSLEKNQSENLEEARQKLLWNIAQVRKGQSGAAR